ncbi:hypothetical protein FB446DRAFT_208219 [Lentinula raphanica]|nr:hypothetical protein FB446DRAFT_208219 [Lentinula raphanica]
MENAVFSFFLHVSLLDVFKQSYAEQLGVMFGIGIDMTVLSSLPLSFFVTIRVLRVRTRNNGGVAILPQIIDRNRSRDQVLGQTNDFVALLGFGHNWLILSRLSYLMFYQSSSNTIVPSPLLFVFCHGPKTVLVSLALTTVFFGLCLQHCGIDQSHWGYFLYVHLMVTLPLMKLMTLSRWIIALFEGRVEISQRLA